jgi:methionine transaminase
MQVHSKFPNLETSIFAVMSALASKHNAINLSQGFPNFNPSERLQQLVFEQMKAGVNQYAPMQGVMALRERIAEKFELLYGILVHPETEVTVTAGATQAIFCAIAAFIRPGDEVILVEPCYDSYRPSVETVGGVAIPYNLSAPDYAVDWAAIRQLITPRTKMICLNTPHNPTGKTLKHEDWLAVCDLLRGTDILLLSDEVYEHLIFDGKIHQTALKYPELRDRTLATYSFGKTFHNTGWKTGYVVASPNLTTEFRKIHQFNVFSANHPIQAAVAIFMSNPDEYMDLPAFYQEKRDFFLAAMQQTRFRPLACEGTYFQLFDYSDISDEPDFIFSQRLTTEFGVATIPISSFFSDKQDEKIIRVCFAKTEELLEKAGEALAKV